MQNLLLKTNQIKQELVSDLRETFVLRNGGAFCVGTDIGSILFRTVFTDFGLAPDLLDTGIYLF